MLIGMKIGTGTTAKVLRFSYDANGIAVAVDYSLDNGDNFTTYYYLRNAQNDVVKLIDNSGTTVVEYTYDSWGKPFAATGTLANTVGKDQPFRYRGYVYDAETGWYYLRSRYYDPTTCRFINADVLLSTGQGIIGHNAFAYCLNNPVNCEDTDGERPRAAVLGIKIHLAIQQYMKENMVEGRMWYPSVRIDRNRYGLGNIGWIDLVDETGGIYEIKPANNPGYYYFGLNTQLPNYKSASVTDPILDTFNELYIGDLTFSGIVTVDGKMFHFDCNGDGMIIYWEVEERGTDLVPVIAEVPVKRHSYSYGYNRHSNDFLPGVLVFLGCAAVGFGGIYTGCREMNLHPKY